MPKLYEYLGLVIYFYSREHEPIHVHGECDDRESKAEIIIEDGQITEIRIVEVSKRRPLTGRDMQNFQKLVSVFADEIVRKWIDYFVYHKSVEFERITRKLP